MLKVLLTYTSNPASGSVAKYFLDFADEAGADVTVIKPRHNGTRPGKKALPASLTRLSGCFALPGYFGCNGVRQAVESSRLFSYDLLLSGPGAGKKWLGSTPSTLLAQKAWAPVIRIPGKAEFKPINNILFLDNQLFKSKQPIFDKLSMLWRQRRFLYPLKRARSGVGRYHYHRFDETGYPGFPRLNKEFLLQYIQQHRIALVVMNLNKHKDDSNLLEELPVPVLAFNSRNLHISGPGIPLPAFPALEKVALAKRLKNK
ncbi:MAG: hypothetical protein H6558_21290 [Lewinellaceae bacterium]|nr:hypothetical protein [Lewinellaceae bacterium]